MATLKFSRVATTLYPQSLTACLPHLKVVPRFFRQNDDKGCSLDYLGSFGHFFFYFGAAGEIIKDVVTTPLVRRDVIHLPNVGTVQRFTLMPLITYRSCILNFF